MADKENLQPSRLPRRVQQAPKRPPLNERNAKTTTTCLKATTSTCVKSNVKATNSSNTKTTAEHNNKDILQQYLNEWQLCMHRKITLRNHQLTATVHNKQRMQHSMFQRWRSAHKQSQLSNRMLIRADRVYEKCLLKRHLQQWMCLNRQLDSRNKLEGLVGVHLDGRRVRMLKRRYFYCWLRSTNDDDDCDDAREEENSHSKRRWMALTVALWSRKVYRQTFDRWRQLAYLNRMNQQIQKQSEQLYKQRLLTNAIERWRLERFFQLNRRLIEQRAEKLNLRFVLYRHLKCWHLFASCQMNDRWLSQRAISFETNWQMTKYFHLWRLKNRLLSNRILLVDTKYAVKSQLYYFNLWLARLKGVMGDLNEMCQIFQKEKETKIIQATFNEFKRPLKMLPLTAVMQERTKKYILKVWLVESRSREFDRQKKEKSTKNFLSNWREKYRKLNSDRQMFQMAQDFDTRNVKLSIICGFVQKCKIIYQLHLILTDFSIRQNQRIICGAFKAFQLSSVKRLNEQYAVHCLLEKRCFLRRWRQLTEMCGLADEFFKQNLTRPALIVWRLNLERRRRLSCRQAFDNWLNVNNDRQEDASTKESKTSHSSSHSTQSRNGQVFRPAIEESMRIVDVCEEISFIEERLLEYKREKEKILQFKQKLSSFNNSSNWKSHSYHDCIRRYHADDESRRQDIEALSNRLGVLQSCLLRK